MTFRGRIDSVLETRKLPDDAVVEYLAKSLDLEPIRAGHADDIFTPVDPDELVRRLASVGFRGTRTDILGFHFRFVSQKPS